MTRTRYKTEVKLFAINERAKGKKWSIIRQEIEKQFGVKAPTVRGMEKWEKTLDREAITSELMKDVQAQIPKQIDSAQIQVAQGLLPVLFTARDAGKDVETAAWRWFFQWVEGYLGRERFKQMIDEYFTATNITTPDTKEETTL
jgi:hypothetical protein